jgi:hypothetical protein
MSNQPSSQKNSNEETVLGWKFKALKEKLVPQFKKLTKAIKLKRNGKRDCAQ